MKRETITLFLSLINGDYTKLDKHAHMTRRWWVICFVLNAALNNQVRTSEMTVLFYTEHRTGAFT